MKNSKKNKPKSPHNRCKEKLRKLAELDEKIEETDSKISELQQHEGDLSGVDMQKISREKRRLLLQGHGASNSSEALSAESTPKNHW